MAVNFDLQRRLGTGRFGEVWFAIETGLDIPLAVKLILPSNVLNPENLFQEAQILKAVEHPNIVRVEDTGRMADGRIYVSMEYLSKGSLEDVVKGAYVDLSRAKRIMIDVLRGLEYAHAKNILHRDIKPANILIGDNFESKLSDFGLAIPLGTDLRTLGIKDYGYIMHLAPEIFTDSQYSIASDIYACGMTLYRLVNGDSYLSQFVVDELRTKVINGAFPDRKSYREFIPRSISLIVNKALHVDRTQRFQSAEEFRRALERVEIFINWGEKMLSNGKRWRSSCGNSCYEIRRVQERSGKWTIASKKGRLMSKLRKINRFCHENLTKKDAEKITKKILQDFTCGKEK